MELRQKVSRLDSFVSEDERIELAMNVTQILVEWDLSIKDQLKLLGLSETSRATLYAYRSGKSPIPYDQDKIERAALIMLIYVLLNSIFPDNNEIHKKWLKGINSEFASPHPTSALDIIKDYGMLGFARVARCLESLTVI
jgi:hypothetical protein